LSEFATVSGWRGMPLFHAAAGKPAHGFTHLDTMRSQADDRCDEPPACDARLCCINALPIATVMPRQRVD
jgi:hypothetical protein